jgi:hypothetical protein
MTHPAPDHRPLTVDEYEGVELAGVREEGLAAYEA